jgi:hypothetical protein
MRSLTRSRIFAGAAATIVSTVLAVSAAAGEHIPFKGSMQGVDVDSAGPLPNTITVTTTGTGVATHLGAFSLTEVNVVSFLTGTAKGTVHYVAANGDTVDSTFVASGEPAENGLLKITEVHDITGGTGRFAGAQGSFTVDRLASPTTFLTAGSFHGTITSAGFLH